MTIEATIFTAVGPLCSNRVYPDTAPQGATLPYVTYQQIGGRTADFLEGGAPVKRNGRIQFNVWATTRVAANTLMRQIEDTLLASPYYFRPLGALVALYDEEVKQYGAQQDISCWWS